jgi:hypothetical protein
LIVDRLTDLGESHAAAGSAGLLAALDGTELDAVFARLADRDAHDDRPGGPGADRPARRRIETLAAALVPRFRQLPPRAGRSGLTAVARQLAARPGYAGVAATALVGLGRLDNLDEIADLCAGRPVLAARVAGEVGGRLRELPELLDPAVLPAAVGRLAGRGDLAGGLFAVALIRPGATFGWSAPWRDRLLELRRHPDADVREQAYAVDMT